MNDMTSGSTYFVFVIKFRFDLVLYIINPNCERMNDKMRTANDMTSGSTFFMSAVVELVLDCSSLKNVFPADQSVKCGSETKA